MYRLQTFVGSGDITGENPMFNGCHLEWNRRLVENAYVAEPPDTLFDTTTRRTEDVADALIAWTLNHLNKD